MSPVSKKKKKARKDGTVMVRPTRKEFGNLVEMIQGEFPAPLYKHFFGPFNGTKDFPSRPKLPDPPEGVFEHTSHEYEPITDGGIVELADGRLMMASGSGLNESVGRTTYRFSKNGGATWSKAKAVRFGMGIGGMIRLQSGALAVYGRKSKNSPNIYYFSTSKDDGRTWATPKLLPTHTDFHPLFHSLIQLRSGRLLLAGYCAGGELKCDPPDLKRLTASGKGWWRGVLMNKEGHRSPGLGVCKTYYSDDQGKTWHGCAGGMFGWFNEHGIPDGTGGVTGVCEPTVAETVDGRLLMLCRSRRGRLVQCYSYDEGEHWQSMQPSELSSSQAPAMLVSLPETGDLLCVWNQVSGREIRRGCQRCRLSSAISKDSGRNWCHFKTIESSEGMEEVDRIAPEFPIPGLVRGNTELEQFADAYRTVDYPNMDVVGDKVILRHSRQWPIMCGKGRAEITGEGVLRVYPIGWFYE